jgi:hypothetical protein
MHAQLPHHRNGVVNTTQSAGQGAMSMIGNQIGMDGGGPGSGPGPGLDRGKQGAFEVEGHTDGGKRSKMKGR